MCRDFPNSCHKPHEGVDQKCTVHPQCTWGLLLQEAVQEISQKRRLAEQQRRMSMQNRRGQPASAAQETGVDGAREEGLCVVCIDSRADSVFLCGHMCVCELCATGLSTCPICRRRSRHIRVFAT